MKASSSNLVIAMAVIALFAANAVLAQGSLSFTVFDAPTEPPN
jgi:hypothetical protein